MTSTNPIAGDPPQMAPTQPLVFDGPVYKMNADLGPITKLKMPSFRNGDLTQARSLLIKPTIPAAYHWTPIQGLSCEGALEHTEAYIRSAAATMADHAPAQLTDAQKRKAAICLGVARAVTTDLYRLTEADFIPGELAMPVLEAKKVGAAVVGFGTRGNVGAAGKTSLDTAFELDETEKAAVAALHMSALGVPVVQGYSLVMTDHHYLSDTKSQSYKAFLAIERQFWEASSVKKWFTDDIELIRDVLWHKSCHPINLNFKTQLAHDPGVAKLLTSAGAGSAASRLPALETELRTANSYKTLLQTVRPMYEAMGCATNYIVLDEAIAAVNLFPYGVLVETVELMPTVPKYVNNRLKALMHLRYTLEGNTDLVAHAFGFYCALAEQGQLMTGGQTGDSLKTSYSLKKLKNQSYASYIAGQNMFGDYTAMKAAKRAAGEYEKVSLVLWPVAEGGVMAIPNKR